MSKKQINFDLLVPNSQSKRSTLGAGPRAVVYLRPPGGSTVRGMRIDALVDTGAHGLFLPLAPLRKLGYAVTGPQVSRVRVLTTGGMVTMQRLPVHVSIYGINFTTDAYLGQNQEALIGRAAIFSFLEAIGLRDKEWLLKFPPSGSAQAGAGTAAASDPAKQAQINDFGDFLQIGSTRLNKRDWD